MSLLLSQVEAVAAPALSPRGSKESISAPRSMRRRFRETLMGIISVVASRPWPSPWGGYCDPDRE
jgi:hypothetical protein